MENLNSRIPQTLRKGDSLVLDDMDLSDTYPASTWTLTIFIVNSSVQFEKDATADGVLHDLTLTTTDTATLSEGFNQWVFKVTDGTEVNTIFDGTIEILPDLAAAQDTRTHARKTLESLEAVIETRATTDQMNYEISGPGGTRKLSRMSFEELVDLRDKYRQKVNSEEAKDNIAAGRGSGRKVKTRFVSS